MPVSSVSLFGSQREELDAIMPFLISYLEETLVNSAIKHKWKTSIWSGLQKLNLHLSWTQTEHLLNILVL